MYFWYCSLCAHATLRVTALLILLIVCTCNIESDCTSDIAHCVHMLHWEWLYFWYCLLCAHATLRVTVLLILLIVYTCYIESDCTSDIVYCAHLQLQWCWVTVQLVCKIVHTMCKEGKFSCLATDKLIFMAMPFVNVWQKKKIPMGESQSNRCFIIATCLSQC